MAAADESLDRMRTVLDHAEPVITRNPDDPLDLARAPGKVNGNDRARPGRQTAEDLGGREAMRLLIDVRKHRAGPGVDDRVRGRGERHRRHDHLITRLEIERNHRQVKRSGARVHGKRMLSADVDAKRLLEPRHSRPGPNPGRPQSREDLVDFWLEQLGRAEDEVVGTCG